MICGRILSVCRAALIALLFAAGTGCSDSSDTQQSQPATSRNLPITVEQSAGLSDYNIYRPADLFATLSPLPVIVWTSGGCVRYDGAWRQLLEKWARSGFVAIAPTVPADSSDPRSSTTSVDDQAGVIDWVYAENGREGSTYAGRFDLDRVVAAGNSCGGIVSLSLASLDDRVRSVFVLSGSSVPPGGSEEAAAAIMGNILVPVAHVVGGPEDIATHYAQQDYDLLPVGVPGFLARRSEADHRTVSTDPGILDEVAEISTNWIDFTLTANPRVRRMLVENPCGHCAPETWSVQAKNLELHVAP